MSASSEQSRLHAPESVSTSSSAIGTGKSASGGGGTTLSSRPVRSRSSGFEVGVGAMKEVTKAQQAEAHGTQGGGGAVNTSGLALDLPSVMGISRTNSNSSVNTNTQGASGRAGSSSKHSLPFTPITPMRSPAVMPHYTQVSSSPSVAAGVPVLELIRKFEEEKILNRDDRLSLNEALYNPERREGIVKALQAIELGSNSRFAIRRLKALIHQNGIGEISSKSINQYKADGVPRIDNFALSPEGRGGQGGKNDNDSVGANGYGGGSRSPTNIGFSGKENNNGESPSPNSPSKRSQSGNTPSNRHNNYINKAQPLVNTQNAIDQVISTTPMYVNPENFNVCSKIARRLRDFLTKYKPSAMGVRKFAVMIGGGSFNPLTRMHLRAYFVAKQYLEAQCGFVVLGSLLSPAHSMTVRERYRTNQKEILPSPHRLAISQMLVKDSKWLSIDPWEITRRRPMDYLSLIEHTHQMLGSHFPEIEFKVIYLAKANTVPKIAPAHLKAIEGEVGVVSVCRAMEYDMVQAGLSAKWNGLFYCVEDTAVLDSTLDVVTSRKVREKMRAGHGIAHLVGDNIDLYARTHRLGAKMNAQEEWSEEEKILPVAASRPVELNIGTIRSSSSSSSISAMSSARLGSQDRESIVLNDGGLVLPLERIGEADDQEQNQELDNDDESVGDSVVGGYRDINVAVGDTFNTTTGGKKGEEPAYEPSWSPRATGGTAGTVSASVGNKAVAVLSSGVIMPSRSL